MKLVYIFAAILAVAIAEGNDQKYDDLVAMETMELKKEFSDLTPEASVYSYVPDQRPQYWNQPPFAPSQTWNPPKVDSIQPVHTHVPIPVSPPYVPPVTASPPVQSDYVPQNDYYPQNSWVHHPQTTTPVAVIKNEQQFWPNGAYRYEYKIADGTHVGEEGYHTDPKNTEESLVKRGWYSYVGADGKTYTVNWWADHTGFHASGDHLPKQPVNPPKQTYYRTPQPTYPPQQSGYGSYVY